jgi:hypothetical protein
VVYARRVPKAWKTGQPIEERATLSGLFIKTGPAAKVEAGGKASADGKPAPMAIAGPPPLLLVADRVAWHNDTLLGGLGVDMGLLDVLSDHKPAAAAIGKGGKPRPVAIDDESRARNTAEEWDYFFQLLVAAGRADATQLRQQAWSEQLAQQAAEPPPKPEQLDVPSNSYVLRDVLGDPGKQHGRLATLSGVARKVALVRVGVEDRQRFGLDHYYEIDASITLDPATKQQQRDADGNQRTVTSNTWPVTICVREVPEGFPANNDDVRVRIRVPAAFFFKIWMVRTEGTVAEGGKTLKPIPLFVARTIDSLPEPALTSADTSLGLWAAGVFAAAVLALAVAVWSSMRRDKQFQTEVLSKQFAVEKGTSLDEIGLTTTGPPDFRKLD